MLRIIVSGENEVIANLRGMAMAVQAALIAKMQELTLLIEARVKEKLSGEVLNVGKNRPGHTGGQLRASVSQKVEVIGQTILGSIFSSGDVVYAAIHEYGGTTSAHIIVPKRASVLAFIPDKGAVGELSRAGKSGTVFASKVDHPGSHIPERSYMRSTLNEMSSQISLGIKQAVVTTIQARSH